MLGYYGLFPERFFAPAYFGRRYFGRRYFAFITAPSNLVTVGLANREVTVPAVGAAPGMSEAGRVVTVPSVIRSVAVQAAVRTVVAEPSEREV